MNKQELEKQYRKMLTPRYWAGTDRNPEDIAYDYAKFAEQNGLKTIHLFPEKKSKIAHSNIVRKILRSPRWTLVDVNPSDWK